MQVINQVLPTDPAQMQAMMAPGPSEPIFMINLLKFKDVAVYEDGRETDLSGRDAYNIYGHEVAILLPKFGGVAVFGADVTHLMLGKVEDLWDEIAIVAYANRAALLQMSMSPEWQEISVHRTAGLQGQLNIETTLMSGGVSLDAINKIATDLANQ